MHKCVCASMPVYVYVVYLCLCVGMPICIFDCLHTCIYCVSVPCLLLFVRVSVLFYLCEDHGVLELENEDIFG